MSLMRVLAKAKFYISRSMTFLTLITTTMICLMFFQSYSWILAEFGLPMIVVYIVGTPAIVVGGVVFGLLDFKRGTGKHEANLAWENAPLAMELVNNVRELRKENKEMRERLSLLCGDDGK